MFVVDDATFVAADVHLPETHATETEEFYESKPADLRPRNKPASRAVYRRDHTSWQLLPAWAVLTGRSPGDPLERGFRGVTQEEIYEGSTSTSRVGE